MNYLIKYFFFVLFFCAQFSYTQTVYEIDEYNDQIISVCEGIFTDSNAASNGENYENIEDHSITICPDSPGTGQAIQLEFTAFSVLGNISGGVPSDDFMIIYNGEDDSGTGTPYVGTMTSGASSVPGIITAEINADNPEGCLTITFQSNNTVGFAGWEANISCFEPCQEISNPLISTTPELTDFQLSVDVDEAVQFQGSADFAVSNASAVYTWDFGDGTTGIGQNLEHTYTTAGIFDVTLTVSDSSCSDDSTTILAVPIQLIVGSSAAGFAYVDAGEDVLLGCETSTQLSASFLDIGETNIYNLSEIPFVPPFPFEGLANSVNTNIDDAWDNAQDIPFTNGFCFFGNQEGQFQVGSNGVIRFDVDPNDTGAGTNAWNFSANLPNNTQDALGEANIFSPVHDIDPSVLGANEEIAWEIIGEYPNRVLAVSFFDVPLFGDNSQLATHMAVIYETTNIIDIYILNKPNDQSGTAWQNDAAALGIQNHSGTIAYVPEGRNTSDGPWTAQEEAWRFTPSGDTVTLFEWFAGDIDSVNDGTAEFISNEPTIDVSPESTTTYTSKVTYTTCSGFRVNVEDEVIVTVDEDPPYVVELPPDQDLCIGDEDIFLNVDINSPTAIYEWTLNGETIAGADGPSITVSSPNSGEYVAIVSDEECVIQDDIIITFNELDDPFFEMTPTCDGGVVDTTTLATPGAPPQ